MLAGGTDYNVFIAWRIPSGEPILPTLGRPEDFEWEDEDGEMGLVTSPPEAWEDEVEELDEPDEPPVAEGYDARHALLAGLVGRVLRGKLGLGKFRQEVVTKKLLD